MLILGGVIVVVAAVVLVLSSGGGGKSTGQASAGGQGTAKTTSTSSSKGSTHKTRRTSSHHSESTAPAVSPSATTVTVLNGTNTTGLAHGLSQDLQRSGYSQATALNGTPPGSHAKTVVEYTNGHKAEAQGVASSLNVTQVQPMETAVSSLTGAATVVVVAGEDKATSVP